MINTSDQVYKPSKLRQQAEEQLRKGRRKEKTTQPSAETLKLLHELQVHKIELELQNQELQESRAQAEIALQHYTDLYDFSITGYFTFDCNGIILQTNLMGASFLEMERSKVLGKRFASFIVPEESSVFHDLLKRVFVTQQRQSCEVSLLEKGHSFKVVQIEATIVNKEPKQKGLYPPFQCRAIVQDITERIQKEKLARQHQLELTQVARVNSMGELASAIAHEINQPLSVILNYVNGCVRRLESNDYKISEILDAMRLAAKQVELAGEIMHHMKNIARQDETYYKPVSINSIAEAAAVQIQKESHYNFSISLELKLAENLPLVNAVHIQIELVILNLLRNSLEAVHKAKVFKPKIILKTKRQNNMIVVSVTDNGPHYSLLEEQHLFEPCFTTKKTGMGMGLSISRTIVEAHSGHLSAEKLPVSGVRFQFTLPINMQDSTDT